MQGKGKVKAKESGTRLHAFLDEENKEEMVALLKLSEELHFRGRCRALGASQ